MLESVYINDRSDANVLVWSQPVARHLLEGMQTRGWYVPSFLSVLAAFKALSVRITWSQLANRTWVSVELGCL